MDKINTYLLILIIVILLFVTWMVYGNKNDTADQSNLLVAMAKKLGAVESEPEHPKKKTQEHKKTEEEEFEISRIADKICFFNELTPDEQNFYNKFKAEIDAELVYSKQIFHSLITKFLSGTQTKDFTKEENDFYAANQEEIDSVVQDKKYFDSIIQKLVAGQTNFSQEELQYQANNAKEIESELARIKSLKDSGNSPLKGANPPLARGERLKIILSLFEDGIPKTVTEVAELYAKRTNTVASKGNMKDTFGKLEGKQLLWQEIERNSRKQIFYGLPEWFDGKKLKPEFKKRIV